VHFVKERKICTKVFGSDSQVHKMITQQFTLYRVMEVWRPPPLDSWFQRPILNFTPGPQR
jgi:hypothetical protein